MVDLNVNLCLTTFGGWRSRGKRQRSKNEFYQKLITFDGQHVVPLNFKSVCTLIWETNICKIFVFTSRDSGSKVK